MAYVALMSKILVLSVFFFCSGYCASAAVVDGIIFNSNGQAIGIKNLKVGRSGVYHFYDVDFHDNGMKLVSFNDIFGSGEFVADQTYKQYPFSSQGVYNNAIGSAMTIVLQRYDRRAPNGQFQFPPINTNNNSVTLATLDSADGAPAISVYTAFENGGNVTPILRDMKFEDRSFASATFLGERPIVAAVPLPASLPIFLLAFHFLAAFVIAGRVLRKILFKKYVSLSVE